MTRRTIFYMAIVSGFAVLVAMALIILRGHNPWQRVYHDPFDRFRSSVVRDTNKLEKVVLWAREVLRTNQVQGADTDIPWSMLPKELAGMYQGPYADETRPVAAIRPVQGGGAFVGIYFVPGRYLSCAILIGDKDFVCPVGSATREERLQDGVYVLATWYPGR